MDNLMNNFNITFQNDNNLGFNIFYMNIHSLRNKMDSLEILLKMYTKSPDVIVICETWLSSSTAVFYGFDGYVAVHNCRDDGFAGLSIFLKRDIDFEVLLNEKLGRNQLILLDLKTCNFKLFAIYRDSAVVVPTLFFQYMDSILEKYMNCLVVGDINIDLYRDTSTVNECKEIFLSNNFCLLNKVDADSYTYYGPYGASLIDHIYSDMADRVYNINRVPTPISDHVAFFISVSDVPRDTNPECLVSRTDFGMVSDSISRRFDGCEFLDFYVFLNIFLEIVANCTKQVKRKKRRENQAPWFCFEVLCAISVRDYWYRRHKMYPSCAYLKANLRRSKNCVTRVVRNCKRRYFSDLISRNIGNSSKTWSVLNFLMYNRDIKTRSVIKEIRDVDRSGALVRDEMGICNVFNDYFTSIAGNLESDLLRRNNFRARVATMTHWVASSIATMCTDFSEVNYFVLGMNNSAASGADRISVKLMKQCGSNLISVLVRVFNYHISNGIFPDTLKVARTVPIYKSGDHKLPGNYRPISVLSNFSKIFEKLIYARLSGFYDRMGFINPAQFGFVKDSNTTTAAMNFVTLIREYMNGRQFASAIFIDVSKAFDCVSHEILLEKLYRSGVRGVFYDLLKSYLLGRSQMVNICNSFSQSRGVGYGVPQGSVLGPLLFSVFINDIFELPLRGKLQLYADDAVISYGHRDLAGLYEDMQHDLNLLSEWFYNNRLSVNAGKTKYILFKDPRRVITTDHQIVLGLDQVERVSSIRYLGLIIDDRLSWEEHIIHVKRKIMSFVGVLHKIKHIIPVRSRLQIFHAHIFSHVSYMNVLWNTACQFRMDSLSRLLNKAVRAVFHEEYNNPDVHTVDLYRRHGLLTLKGLSRLETVLMVYKIKHNLIKHSIELTTNQNVHEHNLRNNFNFYLDFHNNNYGKLSIRRHGADAFNKLPADLKNLLSFGSFRAKVRQHIFATQTV
jgi:hypothetical protein